MRTDRRTPSVHLLLPVCLTPPCTLPSLPCSAAGNNDGPVPGQGNNNDAAPIYPGSFVISGAVTTANVQPGITLALSRCVGWWRRGGGCNLKERWCSGEGA